MRLPWGMRAWELVPEAVVAVGFTVFLVTETSAATSALSSSTAVALTLGTALTWVAGRVLLGRFTPWPLLRAAVFGVAAVAVLDAVVLPSYRDRTVVETLPTARQAETPPVAGSGPATTGPTTSTAPVQVEPELLATAALTGIDHRATGAVSIYRQPDGTLLVGMEEIDIQPGPDYDLYLVPGVDRDDIDGGVRLDDLRGNRGTQYYGVPAGVDVDPGATTILVWCETFAVPIAGATPA